MVPGTVKLWHLPSKQLIKTLFTWAGRDVAIAQPALVAAGHSDGIDLLDFSKYLGVKEKEKIKDARIHPNPVKNKAILEFTPKKNEFFAVKLFDGSFKEISTILEEILENKPQRIPIEVDKLSSGVYYIQISSATTSQTISFIVEK